MLVISRRAGESLIIGDGIEVEILDCSGSQVKLGIRAPREVCVLRKEIYLTGRQNAAASHDASQRAIERLLGRSR
jgi:carbon storage regulator